jgi:asparagine synthase (glutamine-hydrolysing)
MAAGALPLSVKGARALRRLALAPDAALAQKHAYELFETGAKARLYSDGFLGVARRTDPFAPFREAWHACTSTDPIDRAMYVDFRTYLPDDIMTKVDRMSMAVSLEAREPLLDHPLLERAAMVPSSLKLKNGQTKYLLRRLLERRVPRAILERKKQGFAAPIGEWLRGPLSTMTGDLLTDGRLRARGLFQQREVERLWNDHRIGRADHRHRLWQLLMLELWFRQLVDGQQTRTVAATPTLAEAV